MANDATPTAPMALFMTTYKLDKADKGNTDFIVFSNLVNEKFEANGYKRFSANFSATSRSAVLDLEPATIGSPKFDLNIGTYQFKRTVELESGAKYAAIVSANSVNSEEIWHQLVPPNNMNVLWQIPQVIKIAYSSCFLAAMKANESSPGPNIPWGFETWDETGLQLP